ncbi:Alkane 1-monooxygenase [Segniliparus rotundus DSM 44985]|uniref:Alkane 1-monooxygenase n=1 Tax=Segniliparus rotundus (strain ATCC BAA-972 / CDC 1076 / CIP 108378 / DSM 44985 / JCM 13578) TaxID=640132 RepID=D6ZDI3_SEGRD|nr:alkane 1-monooxygenase [Segniliparus rotundus]ADG97247.1 Alkane 1-monooxygenase [Segniliparus rotundus DSM 44985]
MTAHVSAGSPPVAQWRDPKRYWWLIGLVPPTALFLIVPVVMGMNSAGLTSASKALFWIGPVLVYVVLPLLDLRFGPDGANPPDEVMDQLENDKYYRWIVWAFTPFQYATLFFVAYLATADDLHWLGYDHPFTWLDKIGATISIGVLGGIGINTAHELGHKKERLERWLAKITLAQTFYGHFYLEHNRGHHVRVATPEDPASARMGESFWAFWPRSVFGGLRSAWRLEAERFRKLGKSPFSVKNDVINAWLMSVALYAVILVVFGWQLLPLLILQAVFGFSLLESVNYLEHYGLLRQKAPSGRYERAAPRHSWNSDHIVTNVFLYHLQRHSDHHAYPTRRYQTLRSWDGAPNLPSGYASMITLAYFPPLWRRVMDHRVVEHYNGDLTLANLQPGKREKLLARYPSPSAGEDPEIGSAA